MFINCRFERMICKSYNKFSIFIVLIHKYHRIAFVHPAKYKKRQGIPAVKILLLLGQRK